MHSLLALLPLIATVSATTCGYVPTPASPCEGECPVVDPATGWCTDSCGRTCVKDSDCGMWPASPCSACEKGRCTGDAAFGSCPQSEVWQPGMPPIPALPQAWNASFVMQNYTAPTPPQKGFTWYDFSVGGLRQDFPAPCPFVELQNASNDVPCSVLFLEGYNYYVYEPADGSPSTCCKYHFPVWGPESYRNSNASFGGVVDVNGVAADHWKFSYACPWIRPETPGYPARLPAGATTMRDVYTQRGTGIPLRFNETLTSGVSDLQDVAVGPQDTQAVFDDFLAKFTCLDSTMEPEFSRTCNKYNARGRLVYLGYD